MRRLLLLVPLAVAAAAPAGAGGAESTCNFTVNPPFLYAPPGGTVISDVSVECSAPQGRIRIEATLTQDGAIAAATRRDCRKRSTCYVSTDASANDVPGDEVWCTTASASADGIFLGEETICETSDF